MNLKIPPKLIGDIIKNDFVILEDGRVIKIEEI